MLTHLISSGEREIPDHGNSLCKGKEVTVTAAQKTNEGVARDEVEDTGRGRSHSPKRPCVGTVHTEPHRRELTV